MRASAKMNITAFMHCGKCLKQLPKGVSPSDYADLEVGWTKEGFQVWCKRHQCNVCHVDFQGSKHPANIGAHDDTNDPVRNFDVN